MTWWKTTQAHALYQQQDADDALERDVIQTIDDKKEPARLIARRQKERKQQQQATMNDDYKNKHVDNMEQDDSLTQRVDAREGLEEARKSWHSAMSPLQLALELVANVTSMQSGHENDDGMAMEQDDIVWGPEQEAELMAEADAGGLPTATSSQSPMDAALLEALVQSGLADRLVTLIKELCAQVDDAKPLPLDVKNDIEDLQSKCAACLGKCIGNLTASWQVSTELWKDLRSAAECFTGSGTEGVFDTMAVAIRTRPEVRKQIQADDLEFLMNQLSLSTSSDSIKGNVICILGLLCSSELHPREVNENVCSGLLLLLQSSSSPIIMTEVFNALMDMYGDDRHTQVFNSLDVLGNFQRMLPRFKKRIQAESKKDSDENVEQWREASLNASRFISYKKGQT